MMGKGRETGTERGTVRGRGREGEVKKRGRGKGEGEREVYKSPIHIKHANCKRTVNLQPRNTIHLHQVGEVSQNDRVCQTTS